MTKDFRQQVNITVTHEEFAELKKLADAERIKPGTKLRNIMREHLSRQRGDTRVMP